MNSECVCVMSEQCVRFMSEKEREWSVSEREILWIFLLSVKDVGEFVRLLVVESECISSGEIVESEKGFKES